MSNVLVTLIRRVEELERRLANIVREGRVTQRDPQKGIKVAIADVDGKPVETPWIKQSEQGGGMRTWALPALGQHMKIISPDGEIGHNSMAVPHWYANGHDQPSGEADECVIAQVGDTAILIKNGQLTIRSGGVEWTFTGSGFDQTGGHHKHDGKNTGKDHVHGGILPGPANTDVPSN